MPAIVGIHGIAQQVKAAQVLESSWVPALQGGVALVRGEVPTAADISIAFYGDIFRKSGGKSLGQPQLEVDDLDTVEQQFLADMWREAARTDPHVVGPDDATKLRTPKFLQRGLTALSHSTFFAQMAEHLILGIIRQVCLYLTNENIRRQVQHRVDMAVRDDTVVIVGHSLGAVVAYEALHAHPEWDATLITLGAPLGIRNIVLDRLHPSQSNGRGSFPPGARAWTNVADAGDVVALVKSLDPIFGPGVTDKLVHNGARAHDVSPYLTAVETGKAIAAGMEAK